LSSASDLSAQSHLFSILSNPSYDGQLQVSFTSQHQTKRNITVSNQGGVQLIQAVCLPGQLHHSLDVQSLPAGMYLITVQTDKAAQTAKWIKL
jgi:hypothetical protein